jgi:diguanylate cyclase (GGDEF)-like protein
MNKAIRYSYFLVLALCIVYIVAAFIFGKNAVTGHTQETGTQLVEPVEANILDEKTTEYVIMLPETDDKDEVSLALEFFTGHQYVEVYAGETLIYSVSSEPSIFGRSTGSRINMVELPANTEAVRVILQSVFGKSKKAPEFYYGDAAVIVHDIAESSFLDTIMSLLIVAFGMFLVVYWIVSHKRMGQNRSALYFGLFSVMIGMWALNESELIRLIYTNRMAGSLMAYLMLDLMVVPFVQFVRYFFEKEKSTLCNLICSISIVETVLLVALHMSGTLEFKQTSWMIHGMMLVALWYMAFAVWERIQKYGMDRKVKVNTIAVVALLVSSVVDMAAYYANLQQTDVLGKIGFFVYILLLGRESAADTLRKVQEGEKAQDYLKLAMTDVMTGLLNRSAFEDWEDTCTDMTDVMLVTFDLNNLKYCNDHMGHAAGDEYIIESANMINRIFGAIGLCYRIGGDEFCAVIRRASRLNIDKYLDSLREEQNRYNEKSELIKIHIAVGYAIYQDSDAGIEETRSRADVSMYRNKKLLKNQDGDL